MELLEVLITLPPQTVTVPAGATTGTVSVQLLILQNPEPLLLSLNASATGTINDNDAAPTVATITPASATEGSPAVFEFSLSNPSARTTYLYIHQWNCWKC
jgi:hypothetical protein